jgi:hypothetical protein
MGNLLVRSEGRALYINNTDLTDDIVLYSMTHGVYQRMLDAVIVETQMVGLRINVTKTKWFAAIWLPLLAQ